MTGSIDRVIIINKSIDSLMRQICLTGRDEEYERHVKQLKPGETVQWKTLTGKERFTSTRATTIANGEVYDSLRNKN